MHVWYWPRPRTQNPEEVPDDIDDEASGNPERADVALPRVTPVVARCVPPAPPELSSLAEKCFRSCGIFHDE
jgi:hypothetical protein